MVIFHLNYYYFEAEVNINHKLKNVNILQIIMEVIYRFEYSGSVFRVIGKIVVRRLFSFHFFLVLSFPVDRVTRRK